MPIYEYRCASCGHEVEVLQKLSDKPLVSCPECKEDALAKLISAAGFQLKGSGWYVTDFRDSKKKSGESEKSSGSEGLSNSGSGKAETSQAKSEPSNTSTSSAPSNGSSAADSPSAN